MVQMRPKKRHRYTLLDEDDDDDKHRVEMLPKGKCSHYRRFSMK